MNLSERRCHESHEQGAAAAGTVHQNSRSYRAEEKKKGLKRNREFTPSHKKLKISKRLIVA